MYSSNNGWQSLLQQGMGLLGGNSMSYGLNNANFLFGSNGCLGNFSSSGYYTDKQFDTAAGIGAGSAVAGMIVQAIASNKSEKEPEVNYTQEIKKINSEIETKQTEVGKLNNENSKQKAIVNAAPSDEDIINAKTAMEQAKAEKENYTKKQGKASCDDANLIKAYNDAEAKYNDLTSKKAKADAAQKIIEANTKKIGELNDEIDALKKKKAEYQKASDKKTIDSEKSMGWERAKKECIESWQNARTDGTTATKKELERASYEYRHAKTDDDKKKYAKAFINMYDSNSGEFKSKYEVLYKAIKREQNM